ncbi:MAG: arsenic resistance protein [Rubrivivax sp.]|nr:arsenic resistance protein [Rubrivivax sp.]MDP3610399.1 arsenic resistance protein [Rubrivivax sp.]
MQRITLERQQVWIYLGATGLGLGAGSAWPALAPGLEAMLWPTLMLLLYATFVQVPLLHVREAFGDRRFVAAVLIGNFVLLPLVAWVLVGVLALWLPADPVLIVGVLLVLLVPCTDWFITFSQLGGGSVPRAIAVTPLNLLLQLLLLPPWLWLIAGIDGLPQLAAADLASALVVVIVPLVLAAATERWIEARPERDAVRERLAWWPVPLLAIVVFQIAAAQVGAVLEATHMLGAVVPVFVVFLLAAAGIAKLLARWMSLPPDQGRTLAFSLGTRNSFVVLPFALSLPAGWELAAVVIVVQSLVELLGMVFFLWWVPRHLFPLTVPRQVNAAD